MDYNYLKLEQQIRALMNLAHVPSSGSSKTTEELKNGNNTFLVDAIKHYFVFKYGGVSEPISVDPITKSILNVRFINDVDVSKLIGGVSEGYGVSIENIGNGVFKIGVIDNMFALKDDVTDINDKFDDYYTKAECDDGFVNGDAFDEYKQLVSDTYSTKEDVNTTLTKYVQRSEYSTAITNINTSITQHVSGINSSIDSKLLNYYTKEESDDKYALKSDIGNNVDIDLSDYVKTNGDSTINGNLTISGKAKFGNDGRCCIYSYTNQDGFTIHDLPSGGWIRFDEGIFEMNRGLYVRGVLSSTNSISAPTITAQSLSLSNSDASKTITINSDSNKFFIYRNSQKSSNQLEIGTADNDRLTIGYDCTNDSTPHSWITTVTSIGSNTTEIFSDRTVFRQRIDAPSININNTSTDNQNALTITQPNLAANKYTQILVGKGTADNQYIRIGYQQGTYLFGYISTTGSTTQMIFDNNGTTFNRPAYFMYDVDIKGKLKTNGSNTITHLAPIEGNSTFTIGSSAFMSGKVYKRINDEWISSTPDDRTDCICSVVNAGNHKSFVGVVVSIDEENHSLTFASQGDFMFNVDDTSLYEIGDVILYDGCILEDDLTVTSKLHQSIVGKITSIIDEHTLAVFRD